ncbi:MAG: glycoside hydrolase family 78 protein [Solobacterium sp.]|jgi:alpha-L-rhamnosidase|nr:glycoside hydrolase family 78 protein [Solobacterium sp.]
METIPFRFVNTEQSVPDTSKPVPASYVRKSFTVTEPVSKATLYTTALGVYVPYFNGEAVTRQVLLPGSTNYHARVQYLCTDVTAGIQQGNNVIAAIVGEGWYRGSLGAFGGKCFYGNQIKFAAALKLETADGVKWICTDEDTRASQNGMIIGNDLKLGETVDMRKEDPDWDMPDYDDSSWHTCVPAAYEGKVICQEGEDILEHEVFTPKVLHTPNGETVLDFGQNMSGRIEFTVTGTAGTEVKLVLGEAIDENGNFTLKNISQDDQPDKQDENSFVGRLGQTVTCILKDGTQTCITHFMISGFRYAKVENWPEEVKAEQFKAIAIYSDLKQTGTFECSNSKINQFVHNVIWSEKSNFVDVPTDCPHRERAGWTGDINVFSEAACWLNDSDRFLTKWLHDFMTLQQEDGSLPFIVPEVPMIVTKQFNMQTRPYSSAGWSDALISVSAQLYQFYGDRSILEEVYPAACRFVDFDLARAKQKHPLHFYKNQSYYQYILDTGYHWGEWLEPGSSMAKDASRAMMFPDSEVATAWLYYSVNKVSEMAELLGRETDCRKYRALAMRIKDAYRKEFLKHGTVKSKRQCRYVRPVAMGLVSKEEAQQIVHDLNDLCIANQYKIGTGFLTTYQVLQTLTDYGYADTAYHMMEQTKCPGWLYEVDKGATTIWEDWMGIDEKGVPKNSQNHYAPGAACAWLYSRVGGIRPVKPNFEEIRIRPYPGGSLTWANTSYQAKQGKIVSDWKIENNTFLLHVEIPQGIDATVIMPDGTSHVSEPGTHEYQCSNVG